VALGALALIVLLGLWLVFGSQARRRRTYRRAKRLLGRGKWQESLTLVQQQQSQAPLPPFWQERLRGLEGQAHQLASDEALGAERYEEALEHRRLTGTDEADAVAPILEGMLAQVRRLFSLNTPKDTDTAQALSDRVLVLHRTCREALFWQGLCHIRQGKPDLAQAALRAAHEGTDPPCVDVPLYAGMLLLCQGQAPQAVRFLSEANRLAPASPWVSWQLGTAILEAEGDRSLAARALQRAVERFAALRNAASAGDIHRQLAWLDGLPEATSYVRRLAAGYTYTCPIVGNNPAVMARQARLGLAQAQLRLGNFMEAVQLYSRLLEESPPTVPVLRGLGHALARLERYEEAYKHLRIAHDREPLLNPLTAGYLALCAAKGKPTQHEDKAKNVLWAVNLLSQFDLPASVEWASLCSAVHAEARALNLTVMPEDQLRLCNALASVRATDPEAAAAYEHLAASKPDAVRAEHAWLYCRAAQQHGLRNAHELTFFRRTFAETPAARAYYAENQWDFDDLEYAYLERQADRQPGIFPEVLGPDYPAQGIELLLARSRAEEATGHQARALAAAHILHKLAPRETRAVDRLAALSYHQGDLERTAALLQDLHALTPGGPLPLLRLAVVEQRRGNRDRYIDAVKQALERTPAHGRAAVAFLGARLALAKDREQALVWLQECLQYDPQHQDARWCLAALYALAGDRERLREHAGRMTANGTTDSRFAYLTACCHLAAGDYAMAAAASRRAALADPSLAGDCAYLEGLAYYHLKQPAAAASVLEQATRASDKPCPSVDHARGLLGLLRFGNGAFHDAIQCWQAIDPHRREHMKLEEPLRGAIFLSGLRALKAEQFAEAARLFREADQLGLQDHRLKSMLQRALVKEGQRLLALGLPAVHVLEEALQACGQDSRVIALLALAHQQQGNYSEARATLRKIDPLDACVLIQLGVLSLRERHLSQAEQEFSVAHEMAPGSYEACHNLLFTRLSLGKIDLAYSLVPDVITLTSSPEERRRFQLLESLLQVCLARGIGHDAPLRDMTAADEQSLLALIRSLGHVDTAVRLLRCLFDLRPQSIGVRDAYFEALLLEAKALFDRGDWLGAERVLLPRAGDTEGAMRIAYLNLLGCCACLCQNFLDGVQHFKAALRLSENDPQLMQNLALAYEWQGQGDQAQPHWERCLQLLDHQDANPEDYGNRLAFAGYSRLASMYSEKERWPAALTYAEQAVHLRPNDPDALERLFHATVQTHRTPEARRILARLRQVRNDEPQHDLFELELIDTHDLDGIERFIVETERVLKQYPADARVESRGLLFIDHGVALTKDKYRELADRLAKSVKQVRSLPRYRLDWTAIRQTVRELRREFIKLRRIHGRCLPLVRHEEQRRHLREQAGRVERKIEQCRSLEA
jgi:tetratricopeptide (TPR) repeat protein